MTVPYSLKLAITGGILLAGASITLVHVHGQAPQPGPSQAKPSASITTSSGVSENPPAVTVDGQAVPEGTTTLNTPNGKATVTVSGNSASVNTDSSSANNTPSGQLNVSVHTQTGSTGNSYSSNTSFQDASVNSFSSSHSSSEITVTGDDSSTINVQTNP